jgi:hypothetical protein
VKSDRGVVGRPDVRTNQAEAAKIDGEFRNRRELNTVAGRLAQRRSTADDPARRSDWTGEVASEIDRSPDAIGVNSEEHQKNRSKRIKATTADQPADSSEVLCSLPDSLAPL